ncbi:MAG: TIGR00282 family metallophosphoesterase [Dehalococcoidia bacterium]|nr:TIGR00282 family metallophosphoesterase [Dehalococcoidia bacterium]
MRILLIGDVIGKPGRRAVRTLVPGLRQEMGIDLVIANGENTAGGFGITPGTAQELLDSDVDVITSGNHIWKQKEIVPYIEEEWPLIRPANYPEGAPGRGHIRIGDTLVLNLMGRVFMNTLDCPFRTADRLLKEQAGGPNAPRAVIVDFHGEATSEKQAMGWYLDGRVSAVVGTHTHVPTADARILPNGTAFVTDLGMAGPRDSVIGCEPEGVLRGFLTQMPRKLTVATGPVVLNSVLIDVDEERGVATGIQRVDRSLA